eukprot:1156961-Pelagomonas_calceolata.AAC.11
MNISDKSAPTKPPPVNWNRRTALMVMLGLHAKFQSRGYAGWGRAAGVKLTGKQANLGAHAP